MCKSAGKKVDWEHACTGVYWAHLADTLVVKLAQLLAYISLVVPVMSSHWAGAVPPGLMCKCWKNCPIMLSKLDLHQFDFLSLLGLPPIIDYLVTVFLNIYIQYPGFSFLHNLFSVPFVWLPGSFVGHFFTTPCNDSHTLKSTLYDIDLINLRNISSLLHENLIVLQW